MKVKDIVREENRMYKVIKNDPTTGIDLQHPDDPHSTLHLDPEAAKAIAANPDNPNQFTMNPAIAGVMGADAPQGPQQGAEVEMPATEDYELDQDMMQKGRRNRGIGGDATDNYIDDITDHDFEQANGRSMDEGPATTYFVDTSTNPPSVKTTASARVPIKVNAKLDNLTPEVIARAESQGFSQVMLQVNGKTVPAFLSGDRCFVGPTVFQQLTANPQVKEEDDKPANTELKTSSDAEIRARLRLAAQQGKGTKLKDMNPLDRDQWLKSTGQYWDSATQSAKPLPVKESADDKLLQQMLSIAGLR